VFKVSESIKIDSGTFTTNYRIIDDKNLPGSNLLERRLKLLNDKTAKLYPLKDAFYFLGDFIKVAKSGVWFIDYYGKVFTYKKNYTRQTAIF